MKLDEIENKIKALGTKLYPGSNTEKGKAYHELPFLELQKALPTHRKNLQKRIDFIAQHLELKNRIGVDLGCSVGGLTFALQKKGAKMIGVDYDHQAINLAWACEEYFKWGCEFDCADICSKYLLQLKKIDFAIWLNAWMWIVKAHGVEDAKNCLFILSKKAEELIFNTAAGKGDGMMGDFIAKIGINSFNDILKLLEECTVYYSIKNIGEIDDGWYARPFFKCTEQGPWQWMGVKNKSKTVRESYNRIVKTFLDQSLIKYLVKEHQQLEKLSKKHFPNSKLSPDRLCLELEYRGKRLTKETIPSNWQGQIKEILDELKEKNILHRDIRPDNLLVMNGNITLIDFAFSTDLQNNSLEVSDIPELPEAFRRGLGTRFKLEDKFDDQYALEESIDFISKGLKEKKAAK